MASTSGFNNGRQPQNDETDASQAVPAAPCASASYSVVCLFSSCFAWFSSFFSTHLDQSNSVAPSSNPASQSVQNELTNAFHGMAPYPLSSGPKKLPYDVFINHRGPDTKKTLATTLYNTLNGMGLRVFLDSEELELGDSLPKELEEAMRSASLHLAIFSKSYAESPWCLAELSFMLRAGTPIVPVFYHIQPDNVRYASGVFADAFSRHEEKRRHTPEKLREWKDSLYHVSNIRGHVVDTEEDEMGVLKNIVNCVLKDVKNLPFVVAKHPVGLDEAVNDFERATIQSHAEYNHRVQIVGLWGMGGSGKTTLAKHFYNNKYKSMESCSFVFDVREAAAKGELHNKQKQLLQGLTGLKDVRVDNIEVGKSMIASRLKSVRVLIVVDDVDHADQLDALLPNKESLGWGSLVVVTTRELEVLRAWGISMVYKMKALDLHYAEQLFCWHAFLQASPCQGFEALVKSFLKVCHGLPLSLKIFGAHLYGNSNRDYWKHQLDKISRILPRNITGRLKVSYDALDVQEKEIFLDIACFFIGEEKNMVINVWDGSRWNDLHSWERLFNKCLIELDDDGERIRMHDHLRDLGRQVANQQSPYRLWFPQQIIKIPNQIQSIRIRGIASAGRSAHGFEEFPRCSLAGEVVVDTNRGPYSLAASSLGLKILQLTGNYSNHIIADVSRDLLWLRCTDIRQRNLRSFRSLDNLRVLELSEFGRSELEELWETASDAPVQLRGLIIFGCSKFKRFPDSIGCLIHLKQVVINSARSLRELPKEFCLLRWLEHLQIIWCKLSWLPASFGNLISLRHLSLEGCQELSTLPHSFKDLAFLEHLDLNQCDKLNLRSDMLESMRKLQYVNLSGCKQLEMLPFDITNQESLRTLDLRGCTRLREMPMDISLLGKLRVMEIGSERLTSLPNSLEGLSSLTDLRIENCPKLQSLPDSVGCLNLLEHFYIIFSGVESLPISVRQLSNLHTVAIDNSLMRELNLGTGPSSYSLCQLKCLYLSSIKVSKISISQDCCPGLETLQIAQNYNLREIEVLPTTLKELDVIKCKTLKDIRGIAGLVNIQKLKIEACPEMDVLPSFEHSASLQEFVFRKCYGVKKIQGLEYCRALEELRADTRWEEQGIESLEPLQKLKCVELRANRRSGVEGCIQSMQDLQKWPGEILVCTRAVSDAASLVNSFSFPTLYVVDSFTNKSIRSQAKLVQERLPSEDAVIVCFVINCTAPSMTVNMILQISSANSQMFSAEVEEGRWFWLGLFTQRSRYHAIENYTINSYSGQGEVEKGLLVMGKELRFMQAFRDLWALIAN